MYKTKKRKKKGLREGSKGKEVRMFGEGHGDQGKKRRKEVRGKTKEGSGERIQRHDYNLRKRRSEGNGTSGKKDTSRHISNTKDMTADICKTHAYKQIC